MRDDLVDFKGIKNTTGVEGPTGTNNMFVQAFLDAGESQIDRLQGRRHLPRKTARATVARAIGAVIVARA